MTAKTPLVVLTSGDDTSWALINLLRREHGNFPILLETPEVPQASWNQQRKRVGTLRYLSMQLARIALGITRRGTDKIINKIICSYKLDVEQPRLSKIRRVDSVNSHLARETLRVLNPQMVLVLGTRPISNRTLGCTDAPFITFTAGINPAYRGVFGAYFALAKGEPELFGGTVHTLARRGETEQILYQSRVSPQPGDNVHTYMWRITACSRGIVQKAVRDGIAGELKPRDVNLPARTFDTPTLGYYLWTGLTRHVW